MSIGGLGAHPGLRRLCLLYTLEVGLCQTSYLLSIFEYLLSTEPSIVEWVSDTCSLLPIRYVFTS